DLTSINRAYPVEGMAERGGLRPSGGAPLGCFVSFVSLATLALATSCRHPGIPRVAPETHLVGAGVTLSIRPPPSTSTPIVRSGVVPVWVTVANRGRTPLQIRYRDFALSDDLMTDGALLPSELGVAPGTGGCYPKARWRAAPAPPGSSTSGCRPGARRTCASTSRQPTRRRSPAATSSSASTN